MADCSTCDSSKTMHVTVISVFAILALISVILRLWARMINSTRLCSNDYLCIGGLIFASALTLLSVHSYVYWGFFSRSVIGDTDLIVIQFKVLLAAELLWITAVTLIRASVILLYISIFFVKPFRIRCYAILIINLIYFTATVLACCLICQPFTYSWDQSIHGTCGNRKSLDMLIGVFNLLMDTITVALPLPVLWGLQMPIGRKVAISAMFSVGTAICIITLVRIKVTDDITAENNSAQLALIALLTCLESSLGVINACLPVMTPVFKKLKSISLISTVSGWTSSKRSHHSRDEEIPFEPKQISLPIENQKAKEDHRTNIVRLNCHPANNSVNTTFNVAQRP